MMFYDKSIEKIVDFFDLKPVGEQRKNSNKGLDFQILVWNIRASKLDPRDIENF